MAPALGPKAAADVRRDDPHVVCAQAQGARQIGPRAVRRLAGDPHRQPVGPSAVVAWDGDEPRGSSVIGATRGLSTRRLDVDVGLAESAIDVAAFLLERVAQVAVELRVNQRRVWLERRLGRGDSRQRLVLDFTRSAASRAMLAVSATTAATGTPMATTRSLASGG